MNDAIEWRPVSEAELLNEIHRNYDEMSEAQRRLWDAVKVDPQKWQLHPWGDEGNGFWVVGILGQSVVWFNDIEAGFNRSRYNEFGLIRDYWCNQDSLGLVIQYFLDEFQTGHHLGCSVGPPQPCA